jgi:hypothetical protein
MADQPNEALGGYWYYVSDEQLAAFAALSDLERLRWIDDARRLTLMARTPETAERQERLRRGEFITPADDEV